MRPDYNLEAARRWLDTAYPTEKHNAGGDCLNPKCDYEFTDRDKSDMITNSGWFTCEKCGWTHNYLDEAYNMYGQPGGSTKAGISMDDMGNLGEEIIARMIDVPGVGHVMERFVQKKYPVDFIIGQYAVEVKTNHSEAQPRFKLGGADERREKAVWAAERNLQPALIGVRLNFYTDTADIFFRAGLTDTWIGNQKLQHIDSQNFADLNPFPNPIDVPSALYLPEDDETPARATYEDDIPF